jgi:hypothetical protein
MKEQKLNFEISCGRDSSDQVNIRIQDVNSRVEFVEVNLSLDQFALMITGLSYIKCTGSVKRLEVVGKTRITEKRSVLYTGAGFASRENMQQWLLDTQQEEGWSIDNYLGSQRSVIYQNGHHTLHYCVYKYMEPE